LDVPDLHELEVFLTKNAMNTREIQNKTQEQEEEEQDSLAIGTQIIPIAYTPQDPTTTKGKIQGSSSKSIREVDLERERSSLPPSAITWRLEAQP